MRLRCYPCAILRRTTPAFTLAAGYAVCKDHISFPDKTLPPSQRAALLDLRLHPTQEKGTTP
jgi:hypothetical protein